MRLTLVVPDLLWPRQIMRDVLRDADIPALQTLLGRGHRSSVTNTSVESWWSAFFGIRPEQFAAAPLRLSAHGASPGGARWLCADPVHLRVDRHGAMLTDPALLNISAVEARHLHAALAPLFSHLGDLVVTTPSHWHLKLTAGDDVNPAPPPAAVFPAHLNDYIEQPAVSLLPPGDAGRAWRQLFNEVQMLLHAHPLNAERSAHGKAAINSLALWGEGHAPSFSGKAPLAVFSDDQTIAGAGKLARMQVTALPPRFTAPDGDSIVYWDALRFPAAQRDALSWRERLLEFEHAWLNPALAALKKGKLKSIELHGFGDGKGVSAVTSMVDCYCLWRPPRRLESL